MAGGFIRTVRGDIEPDALGFCQPHEHLFVAKNRCFEVNPVIWMDDVDLTTQECVAFKEAGGDSIVDAQPPGCGRMPAALREASERSGVHIIASTGFHRNCYYYDDSWIYTLDEQALTDIFVHDLTVGMYDVCDGPTPPAKWVGAKAGIIKTALDAQGLVGVYPKLFAAAANAALATGAPILCHIERGSDPRDLADFYLGRGIEPSRIIFCHLDRAVPDVAIHKEVAARGIMLEYDTINRLHWHSNEREVEIILELLDTGHLDRVMISLDSTRDRYLSYGGKTGFLYLMCTFIPMLKAAGVTQAQIDVMTRDNPKGCLPFRN